ncbi:MAG: glycosyltransferase [Gemmatimonadaceae bacterium]|nr:glycosyltransferase [Gemmatimonadaceae bacterium]
MAQAGTAALPDLHRAAVRPGPSCPLRVMHVVYALQPGGMEFGVVKVVNGLDPARVQSSICSTAPAVDSMKSLVTPAVPIFELRRRHGNDPRLVWDLYRLFRRERPHIVHTHAWGTLIEGLVAARLARVPVVVHGEHGTLQLRGFQARIQRWAWRGATRVLSVSRKLAERMAATTGFAHDRIQTIQNGVDFSRFSPALREAGREELGLGPNTLAIGTAGRLVPVKDHANLIDALAQLRDRGVTFTAFIAGDGPLRADLETRIAARRLTERVRLLGQRADIERVFAALDVFVLSSKSEGMSNTILEAMASGAPVVATNVGGAEELVDDGRTGLLVSREDSDALAAALEEMAGDRARCRQMGIAARAKAETTFSLSRMLKDYDALYLDLAGPTTVGARQ